MRRRHGLSATMLHVLHQYVTAWPGVPRSMTRRSGDREFAAQLATQALVESDEQVEEWLNRAYLLESVARTYRQEGNRLAAQDAELAALCYRQAAAAADDLEAAE